MDQEQNVPWRQPKVTASAPLFFISEPGWKYRKTEVRLESKAGNSGDSQGKKC